MPTPSRKRSPPPTRRRALELIAASPHGCTEAILIAHGFTRGMLVNLIRGGLATAGTERMVAGGRSVEVARAAQPKSAWPIDFCHDFSQSCRRARQGQGIASAFGTPVHWGCNDSVVADYRRTPSGSRGGERAGARLGARL